MDRHSNLDRHVILRAISSLLVALLLVTSACSGSDPEGTAREAQALLQAGELTEAIELLRVGVEENVGNAQLNHLYGVALFRNQQAALAVWPLRRATRDEEYAVQSGVALARALLATENPTDAIRAADDVLALAPDNLAALRIRADARLKGKDEEASLEDIERILDIEPGDYRMREAKLNALIRLERLDEARDALEELREWALDDAGQSPEAFAHLCVRDGMLTQQQVDVAAGEARLKECLVEFPNNPEVLLQLTDLYDHSGRRNDSIVLIEETLAEGGDALRDSRDGYGMTMELATRLREAGRVDEAEQILRSSAERTGAPLFWAGLRNHYMATGDLDAAVESVDRLLEVQTGKRIDSEDFDYGEVPDDRLFEMADVLIYLGRVERARTVIEHIEEPVYLDLLEARLLEQQGDLAGALAKWDEAFLHWPSNAGARYLAGQVAMRNGEYDRAMVHYRAAIRVGAEATDAALTLARIQLAQGNLRAAADAAMHRIRASPNDLVAMRLQAEIAREMGEIESMQQTRTRMSRTPVGQGQAFSDHARDLAGLEGVEAALSFLEKALEEGEVELNNTDVLLVWSEGMVALGRGEAALSQIDELLSVAPSDAGILTAKAKVLDALGRAKPALQALELAVASDPSNALAWAELGRQLASSNVRADQDRAIQAFEEAIEADPVESGTVYSLAALLRKTGRDAEADQQLKDLLDQQPWQGEAADQLAQSALARGESGDQVLVWAQRAMRFGVAAGVDAIFTLARVRIARSEFEPAVQLMQVAMESGVEGPLAEYYLGRALAGQGDVAGAAKALQASLKDEGLATIDPELAKRARTELDELEKPRSAN